MVEFDYSVYLIRHCLIDEFRILTILEDDEKIYCQFLIMSKEILKYLDVKNLSNHVDYSLAELIIDFFE